MNREYLTQQGFTDQVIISDSEEGLSNLASALRFLRQYGITPTVEFTWIPYTTSTCMIGIKPGLIDIVEFQLRFS